MTLNVLSTSCGLIKSKLKYMLSSPGLWLLALSHSKMETSFLVIFTFLFFQTFGLSIIMTSSNVTCIQRERHSLLVFKQTVLNGYSILSTWTGAECCDWQGVGCDSENGHVVKLDLRNPVPLTDELPNNVPSLGGELSPWLQNLTYLRYMDLSMNDFSGPVLDDLGWVSSLSSLRHLDLSGVTIGKHVDWFHSVNMLPSLITLNLAQCNINIPSTKFVNFTSLNSLDLSFNYINSTIPMWLSNLTSLMHLNLNDNQFLSVPNFIGMCSALASIDLSFNSFETSMPNMLRNLSNLVYLDLSGNMFSGPIHVSLGLLSRLEYLYLGNNKLSGNIPMSLGQLSKLKHLDLSQNSLVGVLSETHFTKLKNLTYLDLSSNSLTMNFSSQWIPPFQLQVLFASSCNIGPHFPNWLQTQTNLQRLHLSSSSIRDTIPEWLENILSHILDLDLSNNQIYGPVHLFKIPSIRVLDLSQNMFSGRLLDLSAGNLASRHVPQTDGTMSPHLEVVNLSKNRFTGSIPVHLCKVPTIQILDLSHNKFSGRLPRCLGNLKYLNVIDLANNIITGVVPSSLGSLRDLISLHLHNNRFEGDIPVSLQKLTELVTMDLGNNLFTGTIPFRIGESLYNLRFLNLESNKLTGKIPLQLCQLDALQYLSLAHNNITGKIPRCFGNLTGMKGLRQLSYEDYDPGSALPGVTVLQYEENILASMKGRQLLYTKTEEFLTSLDLSNNNIVGEIPDALMDLVGLTNLNLSRNLLKGQIPMIIGDLKKLESLDLSMNKLYGRIPQSLTSLNFLSYLNLSFNNFSGPIPVGNQLQTLADPSIYKGNGGLCGPPISKSCNGNSSYNHVGEDEVQDDDEGLRFYEGMGPGFVVGFMGLLGSLHFIRKWRVAYFEMLENVYGWLTISVALTLARLRRKVVE
ncbi:hypothetical protein L1987_10926 [Smallanthus sonchifolius]|uniref:Uncharacterized protein n=1 Tax=Smallanthus sonchifolius TaxID=185202 RepID=A0ACB9JCY7_9ASTR|nr:hypothetical protein L1987_10926 [Smallanthus sonchifolius]